MDTIKKIYNTISAAICILILFTTIAPLLLVIALLNRSFFYGAIQGASLMVVNFQQKRILKGNRKVDKKHYHEQSFFFSYEMRQFYSVGEKFSDVDFSNMQYEIESGHIVECAKRAGIEGFFFDLIKDVFQVLGKDTTLYDGYNIGDKGFIVHYNIKKSVYDTAMQNFKNWSYASGYDKLVQYDIVKK